jgi:hypothetical protein
MAKERIHPMRREYWPKPWQCVFATIQLVTYVHTCEEKYRTRTHDRCLVEFDSMDQLDTYARTMFRINEANGVHYNTDGTLFKIWR